MNSSEAVSNSTSLTSSTSWAVLQEEMIKKMHKSTKTTLIYQLKTIKPVIGEQGLHFLQSTLELLYVLLGDKTV